MTASPAAPRPRILLAEGSDRDAESIDAQLDRTGLRYDLLRVRRRPEFEAALVHPPVDLIVADCSLPGFDGFALLAVAKQQLPNVPVVLLCGVDAEDLATEALRSGATDHVVKRHLARLPGVVLRALSEARERAQRETAEAALVESEANMRLVLDAATLGLWQLRGDGGMKRDERCSAMLGVAHREPIDRDAFLRRIHPADRAGLDRAIDAALADDRGGVLAHECRIATPPSADVRWIAIRGSRLGREAGDVQITGVMQDLTSARTLESKTRRAEVLFRLAAEATDLGIWNIGPEADELWIDDGFRKIAGLPADSGHGFAALLHEVVHPDDRPWLAAVVGNALDTGDDDIDLEHRLIRAGDRSVRWVALRGRRVQGVDGRYRLIGTVRDVTEQHRRQEAMRESNEELERRVADRTAKLRSEMAERSRVEDTLQQMQRLEAVGQLTSGVAHDFNNLLTVVLSNISLINRLLLQQPAVDERVTRRLESMREAANRGSTLTRQLLAFSRRQRLTPQTIDFNDIVLGMRDLLQTTLGGSVHLETRLADDLWLALVDPTQLELIVLNLAINARDAMQVGGSLSVSTSNVALASRRATPEEPEPGDYVCLSVSDTGTGMSDDVRAKAFEPFFTTKDVGKGSGLGLAQVYGFAKQSGGGVRIDTAVGRGTTVHVYMPRARRVPADVALESPTAAIAATAAFGTATAAKAMRETSAHVDLGRTSPAPPGVAPADATVRTTEPRAAQTARPSESGTGRALLLVDDDKAVREATASLLEIHGYRVTQTGDGASALALLQGGLPVDLVIADFAMPRMNGAELAASIRQLRVEVPIVFMTGYADLGALGHVPAHLLLQKPVGEMQLVDRLRDVLVKR